MAQSFLRDVCENPGDDTPRLIYADWIEDNGDPDQAEFIRGQIRLMEIDRTPLDKRPAALHRERTWLYDRGVALLNKQSRINGLNNAQLWAGPLIDLEKRDGKWDSVGFERGFISAVRCGWEGWMRHGYLVSRVCPITEVSVVDRHPIQFSSQGSMIEYYSWRRHMPSEPIIPAIGTSTYVLPDELFSCLSAFKGTMYAEYDSANAAMTDLSGACVRYAQKPPSGIYAS